MDRFVREFCANYQSLLAERINMYAEGNNLKIIQVAYAAESRMPEKALVIFEKQ